MAKAKTNLVKNLIKKIVIAVVFLFFVLVGCFFAFYQKATPGKKVQAKWQLKSLQEMPMANLVTELDKQELLEYKESVDKLATSNVFSDASLPFKSDQAKATNTYMMLVNQRLTGNDKHFHADMNNLIYDIPMWQMCWYNYQHTGDDVNLMKSFSEFLSVIEKGEMTTIEIAENLNTFFYEPTKLFDKLLIPLVLLKNQADQIIENTNSKLESAKLLYLAQLLPFHKSAKKWHSVGLATLKEMPDVLSSADVFLYSYCLIRSARLALKQGEDIDQYILDECKRMAYQLMIRLEPDGAPPQLGTVLTREKYHETLFFASNIFNLNDLRFVAFNGIENVDISVPRKFGDHFQNTKTVVLRNTWNIAWNIPTSSRFLEFNDSLGDDAAQVTLDLKYSQISYFAYNKPLLIVEFPETYFEKDDIKVNWAIPKTWNNKNFTVDEIETHSKKMILQYIRETGSFIIEFKEPIKNLKLCFNECKVHTTKIHNEAVILTSHRNWVSPSILSYSSDYSVRKHQGNLEIKTDGVNLELKEEAEPKIQGYLRTIDIGNASYLVVTGRPLFYEDSLKRRSFGDTRERVLYTISRKAFNDYEIVSRNLGTVLIYNEEESDKLPFSQE